MILRRVTDHVKTQNWFAVGIDFLIVVAGVYIGIYLGDIQTERQHARETGQALLALESEMRSDVDRLDEIIALQTLKAADQHRIIEILGATNVETEELNRLLEIMVGANDTFFPNRSAYRALQTGGHLAALPDEALRIQITRLFERQYLRQDFNSVAYDEQVFTFSSTILAETWDRVGWKLMTSRADSAVILRNGVLVVRDQGDFYLNFLTGTIRPEIIRTLDMIDTYQQRNGP